MNKLYTIIKHNLLTVGMSVIVAGLVLVLIGVTTQPAEKEVSLVSKPTGKIQADKTKPADPKVESATTAEPQGTVTAPTALPAPTASKKSPTAAPKPTSRPTTPTPPSIWSTPPTHAGQFAAGTQIGANKSTRTFYGGDLIISTPTVVSPTTGLTTMITVTVPDGYAAGQPSQAWDNKTPGISLNVGSPNTGTTFTMPLQISGGTPGTQTLHIHTIRNQQGLDTWQYDGWITIIVQ